MTHKPTEETENFAAENEEIYQHIYPKKKREIIKCSIQKEQMT